MDEGSRAARLAAAVTIAREIATPDAWHRKCAERGPSKAVELAVGALEQAAAIERAAAGSSSRRDRFGALAAALRANPAADPLARDVVELARECAMPILLSSRLQRSSPDPPPDPLPSARAMAVGGAHTDAYSKGDKRGLYLAAMRRYAIQLAKNPADTRTLMKLGDLRLRTGDVGGAIECYWQAGDVFAADAHHVRAYAVYLQIQELFSQWPDVASSRSRADLDEKVAAFQAANALDGSKVTTSSHLEQALARAAHGDHRGAQLAVESAIRDGRRETECWAELAIGLRRVGDLDEAINALLHGLTADASQSEQTAMSYEIGDCYECRGTREQALYYFQLVARANPDHDDPRGSVRARTARLADPEPPEPPDDIA